MQAATDEADDDTDLSTLSEVVEDAPIVKFVNLLVNQAVGDRASDIHVEPNESDLRIRFRIDGVLHEVMRSPRSIQAGVISRLKVMADINIAERRIPQDGRITMKVSGRSIDLRVATLPTVYGEKVVMRILDKTQAILKLEDLGFLRRGARAVRGVVHEAVRHDPRDRPDRFGQVDDAVRDAQPAEHAPTATSSRSRIRSSTGCPGINQVQIHPKAGLTFAGALRSILRADPDIVLVGEIRDKETAIIGIEAALTGHLVLSTLHTNDAASTPMRLVEMGVEPFLVTERARLRGRPTARPQALRQVQGAVPADRGRAARSGLADRGAGGGRMADVAPGDRLRFVRAHGLPRPVRYPRGHDDVRGDRSDCVIERRSSEDIQKVALMQGMVSHASRRPAQSGQGHDIARGDLPSRRLMPACTSIFSGAHVTPIPGQPESL